MRFDFVFSYWIFAWYLLYMAKIVQPSPKLVILLGIIENTALLLGMILYGSNLRTISSFILINTFITPFNISIADFIQITLYKIFKNIVLYFISNKWNMKIK